MGGVAFRLHWNARSLMKNLNPIVSIIAGICVLLFPALLNYVVGIYLILAGVLALSHRA